jgi:hypothetical protein
MMAAAWRALAAAACCAGLAAALLVVIGPENAPPDAGHLAVFRQDRSVRLDSNNLVDLLTEAKFESKIRRVRWTGSSLSVDFTVREGEAAESVYADLKTLVAQAIGHTANVRRLLVRFEAAGEREHEGRRELLLAADVRRSDSWIADDWTGLADADLGQDEIWRERLRITATRLWAERFGPAVPES